MQDFIIENGFSKQPRRSLVGAMRAQKHLIISPMAKWYLENNIEITKIYETIEFCPKRPFEKFAKKVVEFRRQGDVNPQLKPIGDAWKLIGFAIILFLLYFSM